MGLMAATKLDGKLYRDEIFADLEQRVAALKEKGVTPGLATVLVGDDPASHSYAVSYTHLTLPTICSV